MKSESAARRLPPRAGAKIAALVVAALFGAAGAHADLVVVQKVEGGGQSGEQTIRVKGDKARCDIAGAVSVIVDGERGESTTLVHAQRGFLTLTPERSKVMLEKMKARAPQESVKLQPTAKKEKVGDYQCEIYTAEVGNVKLTYWLAPEYPNYQAILAQLDVMENSPLAPARNGLAPRTKDLPGMPMKIVSEMSGQKQTITLISAKEENVDPAIFVIPKGYKEMPAPPVKE